MEYEGRHIPNSLEYFRKKRRLSQRKVADLLGLSSRSIVSDWEQGKSFPLGNQLLLLSVIYKTTPSELYSEYIEELHHQLLEKELMPLSTH